jgi:hypothetical protein
MFSKQHFIIKIRDFIKSETGTKYKKSVDTDWEVNAPEPVLHADRLKLFSRNIHNFTKFG